MADFRQRMGAGLGIDPSLIQLLGNQPPDWAPPPDSGTEGLPPDLAALLPPPVAPFHAEMPQFQPYQPPSPWQNALASLAQIQQPGYNRSGDWGPAIAAGFLRGLGGGALLRQQQTELARQQANERTAREAAARNQANLEATKEAAKARGEYVQGIVKQGATRAEKMTSQIKVPWSGEFVDRSSALGQHVAGGGTQKQWDEIQSKKGMFASQSSPFGGANPETNDALHALADRWAISGDFGSLGMGNAPLRMSAMKDAVKRWPGLDVSKSASNFRALSKAQSDIQGNISGVEAFSNTMLSNFDTALSAMAEVPNGSPLWNSPVRKLANKLGSQSVAAFETARQVVIPEAARIVSQGKLGGAPLTDSARKEMQAVIRGDYTPAQFRAVRDILAIDADNRKHAFSQQLEKIQSSMVPLDSRGRPIVRMVRLIAPTGESIILPYTDPGIEKAKSLGAVEVP